MHISACSPTFWIFNFNSASPQAAVPIMAAQGDGLIVAVGSITAFLASPFNGAYAVSCHHWSMHSLLSFTQVKLNRNEMSTPPKNAFGDEKLGAQQTRCLICRSDQYAEP